VEIDRASLQQSLVVLRQGLHQLRAIALNAPLDLPALQQASRNVQHSFQQELELAETLETEALPAPLTAIHTEMNRLMRLLKVDVMGVQTARQVETTQQRLGQLGDRITRLLEFCDGAISLF
jgi:hypothetical protein